MRMWLLTLGFVAVLSTSGWAEVWDFSCTEAVSLLKAAQDRVVQKHDQLQEAKLFNASYKFEQSHDYYTKIAKI